MMMVVMTRVIMPIVMMVGFYIFLRGHNLPGGGFIAGLVTSVALLLQYVASGVGWMHHRMPGDYHPVVALGLLGQGEPHAIFRNEIDGFQANNPEILDGVFITRLTNAGSVISEGFEIDFIWQASDNFSLYGGLANVDAEVDEFKCPVSIDSPLPLLVVLEKTLSCAVLDCAARISPSSVQRPSFFVAPFCAKHKMEPK